MIRDCQELSNGKFDVNAFTSIPLALNCTDVTYSYYCQLYALGYQSKSSDGFMNLLSSSLPFTFFQWGKQDAVASNCCTRALPFSFSDRYSDKPILATNKPHYSPGLVHKDKVDYFPKTLNFKHLTESKDISKGVSTYPSQCNDEYTDFN